MCSRGYYFLDRLSIRYCKHGGSSAPIREWMQKNLVAFAQENPQIKVETVFRPNRHPILIGEYRNGTIRQMCIKNATQKEIWEHIDDLRCCNGHKIAKIGQSVFTKVDSYQGKFDDYLNVNSIDVKYVRP